MRRNLLSCALAGLAALAAAGSGAAPAAAAPDAAARFDRVVIDAGHGGDDFGAEGPAGLREKDLVLDLSRRLAQKLRAQGLDVRFTRDVDAFVALDARTDLANRAGGDLFISIHANASRVKNARGIETYFASPEASDEAAGELARAENAAFGPAAAKLMEGDPLLAILGDLMAQQQLSDSQEFARLAQRELARSGAARSRGVKQAPFVVLMGVRMPAVLVEVGFITNPADEKVLRKPSERERIASGLARAIAAFRKHQDERSGVAHARAGSSR